MHNTDYDTATPRSQNGQDHGNHYIEFDNDNYMDNDLHDPSDDLSMTS
jgi:hypothetical protein